MTISIPMLSSMSINSSLDGLTLQLCTEILNFVHVDYKVWATRKCLQCLSQLLKAGCHPA